MESLNFIVLFSVVMVAWVGRLAHVCASVRQVNESSVLIGREQMLARIPLGTLCPVPVPVPTKRSSYFRLRGERRIDSGRGRPPLHLN